MLNVLIVESDPSVVTRIETLIKQFSKPAKVFVATTEAELENAIRLQNFQMAFLNTHLENDCIVNMVRKFPYRCVPVVYSKDDSNALAAFDVGAVDYFLLPINPERLLTSLKRALTRHHLYSYDLISEANQIHTPMDKEIDFKQRLSVKEPGRIRFVNVNDIIMVKGAGNYVELHTRDGKVILYRETMTMLEEQLDPKVFIRIHRSSIVRKSFVSELRPSDSGEYTVVLETGFELKLPRRNKAKVLELIE
ncbi:MAG: LytTR family DNA-binding domain-containing protein [Pseudomonadota bacterium]